MAGVKISELPLETVLRDTDEVLISRGNTSRRALVASLVRTDDISFWTSQIQALSTQTINVVDGPSIDLTYNNVTRSLSADISVVPISKGGTGQTNYLPNALLVGTGTGTLEQRQLSAGFGIGFFKINTPEDKYFVFTNTAPHSATNLSNSATVDAVTIQSSTGTNTTVQAANNSVAGVMTPVDKIRTSTLWNNLCADTPFNSLERPSLTGIKQALDSFLYVAPAISYFRINGASSVTLEVGQSLSQPALTWNSNKLDPRAVTEYRLTLPLGTIFTNTYTFSAYNDSAIYTAGGIPGTATQQTSSWNVRVTDWTGAQANSTVTANWQYRVYYGVTSSATLTASSVLAGVTSDTNRPLATGRLNLGAKSISPSNQYFYVAYPIRFGATSTLRVNGLNFSDFTQQTITNFTNSQGGVGDYYVYRSNNLLTSSYTIEII
jgi:hypothetical protein